MWVRIIQAAPGYTIGEIIELDYKFGLLLIFEGVAIEWHGPTTSVPTIPHEQAILPPHEQR